jgi:glucose-6-phosphate dehydrogenase assembly protein OpcA
VKLPLERVELEITRLWEEEASRGGAPRVELSTLVALVSEPELLERAQAAVRASVAAQPSRTIVAVWHDGDEASIGAQVALHRNGPGGSACGDAILLEATGAGREWLPENIQRLALPDLPICVWWVGDLPDFDRLFDRTLSFADLVVVDSGAMDLRDLEKLSEVVANARDGYALNDFSWQRLRPLQELVARFFDDQEGRGCLTSPERIVLAFAGRPARDPRFASVLPEDAASTEAGLFFGWIAHALGLPVERAVWSRRDASAEVAEVTVGALSARFERKTRPDVPAGSLLAISFQCRGAHFDIERLDDPWAVRWSREVPGSQVPPQTLRMTMLDEPSMLIRCIERPKRDPLLEASLHAASRVVRAVAPRLSMPPRR